MANQQHARRLWTDRGGSVKSVKRGAGDYLGGQAVYTIKERPGKVGVFSSK